MKYLVLLLLAACGGTLPETRYYQISPEATPPKRGDAMLVVEALSTDTSYDDERIVYRTSPYRLDYYQYHRWSAAPGVMVANFLEQAFERSGRFRAVVRDVTEDAPVVLGGRVVAIEEVDTSKTSWVGHLVIELALTDPKTNQTLWTEQFDETEPLPGQNAEGLAHALSIAMARIVAKAAPIIGDLSERQARLHAERAGSTASSTPR